MRIHFQIAALWRSLVRSSRLDADLAAEMRFHVERETEANIAHGMSPNAARRAARIAFGSVDVAHERSRDGRPGAFFRQMVSDTRFGARLLGNAPVFAVTAIAIVALGIGAATAVFSVVYGVILRPLPYREPERLVNIWLAWKPSLVRTSPAAADVMELRQLRSAYDGVAFQRGVNLGLTGYSEPRRIRAAFVSPNLFPLLGVTAATGRTFAPDEDQPGREQVVVLGEPLWRGHFAADPEIVGKQIRLNSAPYTVVGVMPSGFRYPTAETQAWVPLVVQPAELARQQTQNYRVVARLAGDVTLDQARRETSALAERIQTALGRTEGPGFAVDYMLADTVNTVRPALRLLLGAVLLLLLVACVNLSNLFGARASARRGEFAVRLALGASRQRLIRQAIAESMPVLIVGGVLGIGLAKSALRALLAMAPEGIPRLDSVALSGPVLVFSIGMIILTGVAASIVPAVQAWSSDFASSTRDGGRSSTAGRRRSMARQHGVAAQVAFALPLLVGATVLMRSGLNVMRVDLGFRPERVATVSFDVSRGKYVSNADVTNYYARIMDAVRVVPGVASAGMVNKIPLFDEQTTSVHFERPGAAPSDLIDISSRLVTPDYFSSLGIRLIAGRTFTEGDDADAPGVGIVDERVAQTIWPGESAIGQRFRRGTEGQVFTVVGVVAHVRTVAVDADPRPQVYWSYKQLTQNRMVIAARSETEPSALFAPLVKAIRSVDADQAVYDVRTMTDIVDRSLAQRRLTTMLIAGFGGAALLLAAVGIYGVVAYGVTQRTREFGIRVTLGATRRAVTGLVVWQGTSMALVGSAIGLLLAISAAGVMNTLVYGVAPRDTASILGATALLVLVAVLASYVPARRAARVDPGVTLRSE